MTRIIALACVLVVALPIAAHAQQRPTCNRAQAESLADAGWTRWRTGDVTGAEQSFRRAVEACPSAADPWIGLAYAALRQDAVSLAIARFDSSLALGAQERPDA